MELFDEFELSIEQKKVEEDLAEFNKSYEMGEHLLDYLREKSLMLLDPVLDKEDIHKISMNSVGEIIEYVSGGKPQKPFYGITIQEIIDYNIKNEEEIELTDEEIKSYYDFCEDIGLKPNILDEDKRLDVFERAIIENNEEIVYIQEKMLEAAENDTNSDESINDYSNNKYEGRSNSFLKNERSLTYTPADIKHVNFKDKKENKVLEFIRENRKKIYTLLGAGSLVLGTAAYATGMFGEMEENFQEVEEETDWFNMYWENVFCKLNETAENENFVNDFLAHYNATNHFHYNASYSLVREGGVNPIWFARYLASNQWSREEFEMLPHLHQFDSRLVHDGNFTIFLSEIDAIQDGINKTNSGPLSEMIDSYMALSDLEQRNLFMRPRNITDEPPMTIQEEDLVNRVRRDSEVREQIKGMDPADLHWWAWTEMADEWNIDTSCENETKLLLGISSVFGGYLTNNRHFTDEEVMDYISKQIPAIGLDHLTSDYEFNNSLLWLQRKITPYTIGTGYDLGNVFDEIVFWVDREYEGEPVNVYNQSRELWDEYNFDDAVLGRSGDQALNIMYSAITGNFSEPGDPEDFHGFEQYYDRYFSRFMSEERIPMDCRPVSTTAVLLLNTQNHLYLENDVVVDEPTENSIPFVAEDVRVPNHAGTAYLGRNQTAEMNQRPELVLDPGSWQLVRGNKDFLAVSVPPAMWHEVQSPFGHGRHHMGGQRHHNVLEDRVFEPFWDVSKIPEEYVFNRTDYSLVNEYFTGLHDGLVKVCYGFRNESDHAFSRGKYDLLNIDDVTVIPEYNLLLGVGAASIIPLSYSVYKKNKKED